MSAGYSIICVFAVATAHGQSGGGYTITNTTIDSGGGTAAGGVYLVSGTIGQHDAADLSGGGYFLRGGFWSATPSAGPGTPDPLEPEPAAVGKVRFVSFVVPPSSAGTDTGLRVGLIDLYGQGVCCASGNPNSCNSIACTGSGQCGGAFPQCTQRLLPFEGQVRYVNSFGGVTTCVDSSTFSTSYRCAILGCQPEYRDWGTDVGGLTLHVTGDGIAPSGTYGISHIAESCGSVPSADSCNTASSALSLSTGAWGDVCSAGGGPPDGAANVIDIGCVVNKVKETPPFASEARTWLKQQNPNPVADAINVIDIGNCVDSVKGLPYPFSVTACP